MMLFCKYGVDASDPEAGFVFAHHEDSQLPPDGSYPGCTAIPYAGKIEDLDRFGPAPEQREPDDPRGQVIDWRPRAAPRLDTTTARSAKLAELSDVCGAAIAAGFTSAALGDDHLYPTSDEDQRNLALAAGAATLGAQTKGWTTDLKCAVKDAPAVRTAHTPDQVQRVLTDFVGFKGDLTTKLDGLKAKVVSAVTPDAVAAIAWG